MQQHRGEVDLGNAIHVLHSMKPFQQLRRSVELEANASMSVPVVRPHQRNVWPIAEARDTDLLEVPSSLFPHDRLCRLLKLSAQRLCRLAWCVNCPWVETQP